MPGLATLGWVWWGARTMSSRCRTRSYMSPLIKSMERKTVKQQKYDTIPKKNRMNVVRNSRARPSTAWSIAPSAPRSARPGPSMAHVVAPNMAAEFRMIAR